MGIRITGINKLIWVLKMNASDLTLMITLLIFPFVAIFISAKNPVRAHYLFLFHFDYDITVFIRQLQTYSCLTNIYYPFDP